MHPTMRLDVTFDRLPTSVPTSVKLITIKMLGLPQFSCTAHACIVFSHYSTISDITCNLVVGGSVGTYTNVKILCSLCHMAFECNVRCAAQPALIKSKTLQIHKNRDVRVQSLL